MHVNNSRKKSEAYRNQKGIILNRIILCNDCPFGKLNRIYRQDIKMSKKN